MIAALRRLGGIQQANERAGVQTSLPKNLAASGIAGGGVLSLFASHPSCEDRIAALQRATVLRSA
jgi:heat shock protein HtpX